MTTHAVYFRGLRALIATLFCGSVVVVCGCKTTYTWIDHAEGRLLEASDDIHAVPVTGESWVVPGVDVAFEPVEPGTFRMGSLYPGDSNSTPWHFVTLTKPFWIGKYEVTQEQYSRVVGNNPSNIVVAKRPVNQVTWEEAAYFCLVLTVTENTSGRLPDGYVYRLPTEAEWEYCSRAGSMSEYAHNIKAVAWHAGNSKGRAHAVGLKEANAWGLYDMLGNIAEWCDDRDGAYSSAGTTDPRGPASGTFRIVRGGSWDNAEEVCNHTYRFSYDPGSSNFITGFRVVLAAALKQPQQPSN